MNSPKISVLVPVYKVEPYLQRCIDSVLAQDFQDWEMILVDDGSPDRCPEICDEAAKKDCRITVVHKENGGLPSARLAGFELAKGDYLVFLDSDDWLLEGALTTLYGEILNGKYDIVKARPLRHNGKRSWTESYRINVGVLDSMMEYGMHIIENDIHPYLHSGIYRKGLFSKSVFEPIIRTGISFGEDWFANTLIIDKVDKVKIVDLCVYAYFVNNESHVGTMTLGEKTQQAADAFLYDYLASISPELEVLARNKQYVGWLHSFFTPEFGFNHDRYKKVVSFFNTHPNELTKIKLRFRLFFSCELIFYLYAWIYRILFYYVRLKGKLRKRV